MKKNQLLTTGLLAAALALALPAMAKKAPGEGKGAATKGGDRKMVEMLQLNADQQAKLKEINRKFKEELKTVRMEAKAAAEEFKAAVESAASDAASLKQKFDRLAVLKAKKASLQFEKQLQIRAMLDKKQLEKFISWKAEKKGGKRGAKAGKDREKDDDGDDKDDKD